MNSTRLLGIVAALATTALPALAHHSFSMFDAQKEVVLEGTIKEFQWTNPHVWIQLLVPGANGSVVEWSVEGGSPNLVGRQGWKRNTFKPGDKVVIRINPMRNGEPGGSFVGATLGDGRVLGGLQIPRPTPAATDKPTG